MNKPTIIKEITFHGYTIKHVRVLDLPKGWVQERLEISTKLLELFSDTNEPTTICTKWYSTNIINSD